MYYLYNVVMEEGGREGDGDPPDVNSVILLHWSNTMGVDIVEAVEDAGEPRPGQRPAVLVVAPA